MRIGIFGGSFDPVHLGHIKLALSAKKEYKLDKVIFIPAHRPPHKKDKKLLLGRYRLKMLSLALKPFPYFRIGRYELDRKSVTYTYETLEHYRGKFKSSKLFLLIGGDSLAEISGWKKTGKILELADLIVGRRKKINASAPASIGGGVHFIKRRMPDISSSEIRERIRNGRDISGLVRPGVRDYILKNELYC